MISGTGGNFTWDRDRLVICGGTPGRWHRCHVDRKDVEAYVRENRPSLFADFRPEPETAPARRIDWAKIARDDYEASSPERRAALDAHAAREARAAETALEVPGHFERREMRRPGPARVDIRMLSRQRKAGAAARDEGKVATVVKGWEKPLTLRIEERGEGDDFREVIRFMGAPGGDNAFKLDGDFARLVALETDDEWDRDRFYVCAGRSDGSHDACYVQRDVIEGYLRERRPDLFSSPGPRP
jgi:hypothetical protein